MVHPTYLWRKPCGFEQDALFPVIPFVGASVSGYSTALNTLLKFLSSEFLRLRRLKRVSLDARASET